MLVMSASVFGGSLCVLILTVWILSRERARHERLFASRARRGMDTVLAFVVTQVQAMQRVVSTFFWQLGWRYVVHVTLRKLLLGMSGLYDRLLTYFEYNRNRAKVIKQDRARWQQSKSHLSAVADHKTATALSEQEKKQRKRRALDEQ